MTLDFGVVWARWPELLMGMGGTLFLAISGMILALVIGVLGVAVRRSNSRIGSALVIAFVELIRNTPFLVQIFFIFFALPLIYMLFESLKSGTYAIEIIRGGVESIPKGQTEAGLALGLRQGEIFRKIILKPALRAVFPSLASQFILLTLTTSIATSISAFELTSVAQRIDGDTFRSFEVYFTITVLYLLLSWFVMSLFAVISRAAFTYPTR